MFHLALPSKNLNKTRSFYEKLGFTFGRSVKNSFLIMNFFGHQVVFHFYERTPTTVSMYPRHFGVILDEEEFEAYYGKARNQALTFFEDKFNRFIGEKEEHSTFFLKDPSNNLV